MSRYRLNPTPAQEAVLRDHCGHARYTWNLAVEQHSHWHPGRTDAPGYLEQGRQLTAARAEHPWLAAGSQTVQQQALRDFTPAMAAFYDPANPARRPSWRKAGRHEGFRIVGRGRQWDARRVSRHVGQVWVPKAGWVGRVEERGHRLGEVAQGLLLDRLGAGRQPRVLGSGLGELPALFQVARRAGAAGVPVGVLFDGEVPGVPGVAAVVSQHRLLGGGGGEPVPGHANTLSDGADISGEVKRRSLPGLKAGVSTPRFR